MKVVYIDLFCCDIWFFNSISQLIHMGCQLLTRKKPVFRVFLFFSKSQFHPKQTHPFQLSTPLSHIPTPPKHFHQLSFQNFIPNFSLNVTLFQLLPSKFSLFWLSNFNRIVWYRKDWPVPPNLHQKNISNYQTNWYQIWSKYLAFFHSCPHLT
jgi:hypothetical protein